MIAFTVRSHTLSSCHITVPFSHPCLALFAGALMLQTATQVEYCGGVDKANNLAAQHTTHRKHMRSWMTFVEYFVNCAMANAWVLYDRFGRQRGGSLPISTLDEFGWKLSDELV